MIKTHSLSRIDLFSANKIEQMYDTRGSMGPKASTPSSSVSMGTGASASSSAAAALDVDGSSAAERDEVRRPELVGLPAAVGVAGIPMSFCYHLEIQFRLSSYKQNAKKEKHEIINVDRKKKKGEK